MKRREFVKTSLCLGCAGAFTFKEAFSMPLRFTREEELAMQKFIYKSVEELPKKIRLDICNLCQLNCPACWVREAEEKIKTDGSGFGYVSFHQFKDFIDRNSFIKEIELSNHGEIFLNPDIDKILKYSFEKDIELTAFNGVNLNTISEQTAENLVKYQFRYIVVSIDGATPETYAIYRRGGDFNTVINNIKMINKYKEKYNSKYPVLAYKFILFGHNEHEIEDAKKLADKLGMLMIYDANGVPSYSPVKDVIKVKKLTGLTDVVSNFNRFFEDYRSGKSSWYICTDLFDRPVIDYNGDVLGCCMNMLDSFKVNVFKQGMLKALNDKRILYSKLMLTNFKYNSAINTPCSNCHILKVLKNNDYPIQIGRL